MAYRTGAQGPQSTAGAQGPTLQGAAGAQSPWGTQGPVTGKAAPFSVNSSAHALTGNIDLVLVYRTTMGKTFGIFVTRALPGNADLLSVLPDDIVQMANLIDFRPRQGVYRTLAGGTVEYNVVELTGSNNLNYIEGFVNKSDLSLPQYIQTEVGL